MRFWSNHRGDTIIEVLIAITVLSMALTSSYALANRSSLAVRQSQERAETTKLTETSIEQLKQYIANPGPGKDLPVSGSKFCMVSDSAVKVFNATQNPPVEAQQDDFTQYPSECKTGEYYYVFIERNSNTYTIHGRWYKVTGGGIDETKLVYRVYPDAQASEAAGAIADSCAVNEFRNAFGVCKPCTAPYYPPNYVSPGSNVTKCDPIKPKITATVRITTDCSDATATNRSGISVSLTGGAPTSSQATAGSPSSTTFSNLLWSNGYTIGYTVPTGTNPGGGASYSACGATTASITTPSDPGNAVFVTDPGHHAGHVDTVSFKFRKNCYVVDDYGWVDHGGWVDDYQTQIDYTYWTHDGPDWGPFGPATSTTGPPNTRYGIGDSKNGYPQQYFEGAYPNRARYDLYAGSGTNAGWYNRFAEHPVYKNVYVGHHWVSNLQYEKVGSHAECPS